MNTPMTPEQKIITIAEWEGWRIEQDCHPGAKFVFHKPGGGKWLADFIDGQLPPYLTSRDAICGAVARLDDEQKDKFANYLYDIYLGFNEDPEFHSRELVLSTKSVTNMVIATPDQLVDALLLTLGYEI